MLIQCSSDAIGGNQYSYVIYKSILIAYANKIRLEKSDGKLVAYTGENLPNLETFITIFHAPKVIKTCCTEVSF